VRYQPAAASNGLSNNPYLKESSNDIGDDEYVVQAKRRQQRLALARAQVRERSEQRHAHVRHEREREPTQHLRHLGAAVSHRPRLSRYGDESIRAASCWRDPRGPYVSDRSIA